MIVAVALMVLAAQDAPVGAGPCRTEACGLVVDWGTGGTPATVDRRYGTLSAFPLELLKQLQSVGYRFTENLAGVKVTARVRPRLLRAPCDVISGTGSGDTCTAIGEVRVEFEGEGDRPRDFRVIGRCGGEGEYMIVPRFSQYVAEMFDYNLSSEKKKRPSIKC